MRNFVFILMLSIGLASCGSTHLSMREPNTRVNFKKSDFTFSEQRTAEASTTRILGIDWWRLFSKKTGSVEKDASAAINLANLPVIGSVVVDPTASYALYNLVSANEGYDVIFYPQYVTSVKRPILGIGFLYKKTKVTVTARLGKIN